MNVKFNIFFTMITMAALLLAGCSGAAAATASTHNGLSTATQLAVGTLRLKGTGQAVTSSQARQLLTLWEGYQSVSGADTTSQVELNALIKQIQAEMTSEQLQAIEAMDLSEQSVSEEMQMLGTSADTHSLSSTPTSSNLSQAAPGGGPGGMPGGGGDSVMSAINGNTTTQSTPASTQTAVNEGTAQVSSMLVNALIQMLKTISQTTG
jgi:hypothetical protein